MTVSQLPQLLDAFTVAQRLGVHVNTLRRWSRTGEFVAPLDLPHVSRWAESDVIDWINARRGSSAPTVQIFETNP